jgi:hypothetical protein
MFGQFRGPVSVRKYPRGRASALTSKINVHPEDKIFLPRRPNRRFDLENFPSSSSVPSVSSVRAFSSEPLSYLLGVSNLPRASLGNRSSR